MAENGGDLRTRGAAGAPSPEPPSRARVRRKVGQAIGRFNMIEAGDRVLVAVSGGKDSLALLDILCALQRRAPVRFDLVPFTLDTGYPGFDVDGIREQVARNGFDLAVAEAGIASTIERLRPQTKGVCHLCARLRRGALYGAADRLACNKVALGHHADDVIETFLLNLFFNGEAKSMPPLFRADNGRHVVIRPLCLAFEDEVNRFVADYGIRPVPTPCPEPDILQKERRWVKEHLLSLEGRIPHVKHSILAAMGRVRERSFMDPRHVTGTRQ